MRRGRPTRQENRLSGTPPPPTTTEKITPTTSFDPFDPAQVKGYSNQNVEPTREKSSFSSASKYEFENRFDSEMISSNKDTTINNNDDEDSDNSGNASYPWQLESQTLDPISIPPSKSQSISRTASPQQSVGSGNENNNISSSSNSNNSINNNGGITSSTKSTKSIRDFMERKRAPYATTSSSATSTFESSSSFKVSETPTPTPPLPSTSKEMKSTSSTFSQSKNQRPKPPPKPARFRTKTPVSDTTPASNTPSSPSLRPPSISEFEDKFPALEELYHHLSPNT
ncbi:uncharacterized protein BX664DRAFT_105679 [Halteromyces radiatus]|uniref:uncharacterized protein n=1 Tax=Halteromyces radiatus TaxID=101107 RepID=UPI0022209D7A|nr:uncharacterized protein BX664DRAFT_105679 [Halteromyces radiatus]KAI8093363.1 hypothetical protein BX664DRAFT_105679 [Halteromyces radiatus]